MTVLLAVAGLVVLVVIAFVLVIADSALVHTNSTRLESLAEHLDQRREGSDARIDAVIASVDDFSSWRDALRLLILSVQLAEAVGLALLLGGWLDPAWVIAASSVNGALLFVLTDAVPRRLGREKPERASVTLANSVRRVATFPPLALLARLLVRLGGLVAPSSAADISSSPSAEEIIAFADAAMEDQVIDEDERDLIESVIEFGDTVVREVMVPRTDLTTVPVTATVDEALEVGSAAGFSRIPVVGESIDDVLGLVYMKDLIRAELDEQADAAVGGFLRSGHFVPESKKVAELLKEMQRESFHMAVAVDEYGGIAGVVTLEDLIEEIVGEIVDEYDTPETLVDRQRDGSLRVDARIPIDELNDLAGLELPEGDWDTVGGLVFDRFGRIPGEGEVCESQGYRLRVERVQGRRITRVGILAASAQPERPAAETSTIAVRHD